MESFITSGPGLSLYSARSSLSIIGRCTLYNRGCMIKPYKKPYLNYSRVLLPAQGATLPAQGTSS